MYEYESVCVHLNVAMNWCWYVMSLLPLTIPDGSRPHIRLWRGDSLVGVESFVYRSLHLLRSRIFGATRKQLIRLPIATYTVVTLIFGATRKQLTSLSMLVLDEELNPCSEVHRGWFCKPLRSANFVKVTWIFCKPFRFTIFVKVTLINLSEFGVPGRWPKRPTRWETLSSSDHVRMVVISRTSNY